MRGIILAGGTGSRLYPLTKSVSKQMLPIYNKPMIYYPLTTLIDMGIRDILVITTEKDQLLFQDLLQDGAQWGVNITYTTQSAPRGIAEALIIGDDFIGDEDVTLILGDNIFSHTPNHPVLSHSSVYGKTVSHPERYGVVMPDKFNKLPFVIVEKPEPDLIARNSAAVVGLYTYRNGDHKFASSITPSARGELEITDLNNLLIEKDRLNVLMLDGNSAWFDAGSFDSLLEAGEYVRALEVRQGIKIGCPETAARRRGFI